MRTVTTKNLRIGAAENPKLPSWLAYNLLDDEDEEVREAAEERIRKEDADHSDY